MLTLRVKHGTRLLGECFFWVPCSRVQREHVCACGGWGVAMKAECRGPAWRRIENIHLSFLG